MVCGIEHPWRPRPNWDTPLDDEWWFKIRPERTGCLGSILAPSPAGFRDCRDIAAVHLPDGWSLNTASLSATLPMSEGDEPYMLLPCRPSPDSDIFIAVPVKSVGSTYQRLERAVKFVTEDRWFQWPQQRICLDASWASPSLRTTPRAHSFFLNSVHHSTEVVEIQSSTTWAIARSTPNMYHCRITTCPGLKQAVIWLKQSRSSRSLSQHSVTYFAMVIQVVERLTISERLLAWRKNEDTLECYFSEPCPNYEALDVLERLTAATCKSRIFRLPLYYLRGSVNRKRLFGQTMLYVDIKSEIFDWSWLDRVPATDAIFMLTIWQGLFAFDKTGFREATSLAVCERFRQQVVMGVPLPKFLQELQLSNIQLYYFFMSMNFWYHMTRLTSCFVPRWTSLLKRLKVPLGLGFRVVIIGLDLYPRESAALF
ncbi:hypothetical protein S40293_10354 [Stachybotrys chartarum IBT 40293]|nr:hypothetical protein S40293_10354 [Stachybotrys chartarum IBT 40293]